MQRYRRSHGFNSLTGWIYVRLYSHCCFNSVHYCENHPLLYLVIFSLGILYSYICPVFQTSKHVGEVRSESFRPSGKNKPTFILKFKCALTRLSSLDLTVLGQVMQLFASLCVLFQTFALKIPFLRSFAHYLSLRACYRLLQVVYRSFLTIFAIDVVHWLLGYHSGY